MVKEDKMRKIKTVMSVVCLLILAGFAVSHQAFAGNGKTGIRVAAIYDASKLVNTPTKVYVLKPDEYTRYLDNKLDLKNQPVSGETPLFFSSMANFRFSNTVMASVGA